MATDPLLIAMGERYGVLVTARGCLRGRRTTHVVVPPAKFAGRVILSTNLTAADAVLLKAEDVRRRHDLLLGARPVEILGPLIGREVQQTFIEKPDRPLGT